MDGQCYWVTIRQPASQHGEIHNPLHLAINYYTERIEHEAPKYQNIWNPYGTMSFWSQNKAADFRVQDSRFITYLLHGAESFLRS